MIQLLERVKHSRQGKVLQLASAINQLCETSSLAQYEIDDASQIASTLRQNSDWFRTRELRYSDPVEASSSARASVRASARKVAAAKAAAGTGVPKSGGSRQRRRRSLSTGAQES